MLMKARIEAARGLCLATAVARRPRAPLRHARMTVTPPRCREDLLTPLAKAWSTDMAVEVTEPWACRSTAAWASSRRPAPPSTTATPASLPIYEGTNGIQALDLAGRKLSADDGLALREFLADMRAVCGRCDDELASVAGRLAASADAVEAAAAWLAVRRGTPDALAGAVSFLRLLGDAAGGAVLARAALLARTPPHAARGSHATALARFYGDQVLAAAPGLLAAVTAGAAELEAWAA